MDTEKRPMMLLNMPTIFFNYQDHEILPIIPVGYLFALAPTNHVGF